MQQSRQHLTSLTVTPFGAQKKDGESTEKKKKKKAATVEAAADK